MFQRWVDLTFLHWEVPVDDLRRVLPPGLDVDTFEGKAYIGVVPFRMVDVRPRLCPAVPGLSHFLETNVRTYVHRAGQAPGVWFFSLDAANRLGAWLGRQWFKLPYHYARLSMESVSDGGLVYRGRRAAPPSARYEVHVSGDGPVRPAQVGTLEQFLVERYLLYTHQAGRLVSGQVWHEPYRVRQVSADLVSETLVQTAGLAHPATTPLAHYSPGVDVEVFRLRRDGPTAR